MTIFNGIEKLINEHGSAKILGERLLLAKDQNSAQEKRISELEVQLKESEAEKTTLRSQLQSSQTKSHQLTQKIKDFHKLPLLNFKTPFFYANGDPTPFCPVCWETERIQIHLPAPSRSGVGPSYVCLKCKCEIIHPRTEPGRSRNMSA